MCFDVQELSAWPPKHSLPMELSMVEILGDVEKKSHDELSVPPLFRCNVLLPLGPERYDAFRWLAEDT